MISKNKPAKKFERISLLLLLVALLFSAGIFVYFIFKTQEQSESKTATIINQANIIPEETFNFSNEPQIEDIENQNAANKLWFIKDQESNEIVKNLDEFNSDLTTIWGDYLIYTTKEAGYKLTAYNLKNKDKINFLKREEQDQSDVNYLQVINNVLYISTGAYLGKGNNYYQEKIEDEPTLIENSSGGKIEVRGNHYYLISLKGDACLSNRQYFSFNPETKECSEIFTSIVGCADGEEVLGIDQENNFIIAGHVAINEDNKEVQKYRYVYSLNPDKKEIKNGLIAEYEMPEDVTFLKYDPEKNILMLMNKSAYAFKLTDKILQNLGELPKIPKYYPAKYETENYLEETNFENNSFCIHIKEGKDDLKYVIDFNQALITKETYCDPIATSMKTINEKTAEDKIKELFVSLNLPSNYILTNE